MKDRIIYHIDVNSAFLSWHACYMQEHNPDMPDIRLLPAVIGGNEDLRHGIVLAKSNIAKSHGIVTGEPLANARKKCPNLQIFQPIHSEYVKYSHSFITLLKEYAPIVEQYSIDEAFCDMSGTTRLYGDPVAFAHTLKDIIYDKLHFTVNIGVSTNKLLAKMASDFKKPNMVHTLFPSEIPTKMWPLSVHDLFFVGGATAKKLTALGIHTIGSLANTDPGLIQKHFNKHGITMWNYANGIDHEPVEEVSAERKGYGNSITLPSDVTDSQVAKHILLSLSETVGARIRAAKAYVSVVSVTIVGNDFSKKCHQKSLPSTTNSTDVIYREASLLFDTLWDHTPIRLLGISTSKATTQSYEQISLFDNEKTEKEKKLDQAIDKIRTSFGADSVKRASFLSGLSDSENNKTIG